MSADPRDVQNPNTNAAWQERKLAAMARGQGNIAPVYVTACNLIILQLDKGYLPIFQR